MTSSRYNEQLWQVRVMFVMFVMFARASMFVTYLGTTTTCQRRPQLQSTDQIGRYT